MGSEVSQFALPLLVLLVTHSAALAGLVGGIRLLPYVLFGLPAGALVDRWDRKRIMVLCDTGRAIALGSVPFALALGRLSIAQLLLVSLVEGTLFIFYSLAETACLPQVVRPEQLPEALAFNQVADNSSFVLGPTLGGALYSLARGVPFLVDALSYGASVCSLLLIHVRFQEDRQAAERVSWRALRAEVGEGLAWLWHEPVVRSLAIVTTLLNAAAAGYMLIVIVLAQRAHASSVAIGLIAAMGGLGAFPATLATPWLRRRLGFSRSLLWSAWLWSLTWLGWLFPHNVAELAVATVIAFLPVPVFNTLQFGYRLVVVPDRLQGRVNSVFRVLLFGCAGLGYALTGVLLQAFGARDTLLILFVPQLGAALYASLSRHLRSIRP